MSRGLCVRRRDRTEPRRDMDGAATGGMGVVLFLLPIVGPIVDLDLFGVAHNHDLAAKSFLTLLDKTGETVTYPVHLIRLRFNIRFNIHTVVHVNIVEFRLRRGICGGYASGRGDGL